MPDCNACKQARKDVEPIPFIAYEAEMTRKQNTISKLWILSIVLIVLLFATNAGWLIYNSQFAGETTTVTQDLDTSDGGDAIINDGVHINDGTR